MRPPHKVIFTHGGGRLGNQVIRLLHWAAWAREHAGVVEVLNLSFWAYARYFQMWQEHPGCVFPFRCGSADSLARMYAALPAFVRKGFAAREYLPRLVQATGARLPGCQSVQLDVAAAESLILDDMFLAAVRRAHITLCSGWKIANWALVAKHQGELRKLIEPVADVRKSATQVMAAIRERHDFVIGVFIRQSDYRTWYDGRFFFSAARYAEWLRQVQKLFPKQSIAFVLASESPHAPVLFDGLPVYFASGTPNVGGHWMASWSELSRCDCIVSPPSTFSATAAFLGDISIWPVTTADQQMSLEQILPGGMIDAARHPVFSLSVK